MGSAEVLGQFADQLPDLEDTEGRRISIDRVFGKDGVAVPKAVDGCFDLLTVGYDVLQDAVVTVTSLDKGTQPFVVCDG